VKKKRMRRITTVGSKSLTMRHIIIINPVSKRKVTTALKMMKERKKRRMTRMTHFTNRLR
jgi:trehalose-6-phosphate synthase